MRIRPGLRLQLQVEVMRVQEARVHPVDDSLTDRQRPPVQNPQRGLLVQSQILMEGDQQRDCLPVYKDGYFISRSITPV